VESSPPESSTTAGLPAPVAVDVGSPFISRVN
jgi:hypothetical protein